MSDIVSAEDFGKAYHGVHLFENENGDYVVYGHPDVESLLAAIAEHDREMGHDPARPGYLASIAKKQWMNQFKKDAVGEWSGKLCEESDEGAVAVTIVYDGMAIGHDHD